MTLRGALPALDLDRWLPVFAEGGGTGEGVSYDLKVGVLDALGKRMRAVTMQGATDPAGWSASMASASRCRSRRCAGPRWPARSAPVRAGVTLLSLSRSTKPIGLSFGSFSHWYAAAIIAGIAYVAVMTGCPGAARPAPP